MSTDDDAPGIEPTITTTDILKTMVAQNGHIEVLRGPTGELISVCRTDGKAMFAGFMSREMLDDLLEAGFVSQDGVEDERKVTFFRLTEDGRARG